jgi:precorrin-2 dehydrogenase / sirohydrochlorin ferrochelatase
MRRRQHGLKTRATGGPGGLLSRAVGDYNVGVAQTYPLLLDVTRRPVVVVGGGAVAVRKVRGLLDAGAQRVRVVAVAFHEQMPAEIERIAEAFVPDHLEGAELAFAATNDPAANDAVVRECRRRGILVNRADADEEDPGDFATPAVYRHGPLMIGVSAGGAPALAVAVRDALARSLDPRWGRLAEAMQALRPMVRQAPNLPIARRREIFHDLASAEALAIVGSGGLEALKQWLVLRYPELG